MKVKDVIQTLDNIDTCRQVLYGADDQEGTYITSDIVDLLQKILTAHEELIVQMEVVKK